MSSIARNNEPSGAWESGVRGVRMRRFGATVALVGPDGSGKTSVARAVLESSPLSIKYIYMGGNIESSNIALPTSRLIHQWKVYRHKRTLAQRSGETPRKVSMHGLEHRIDRRGKLWGCARLLRRVSEEVYRQCVSSLYRIRGHVVLYDRHFLFDACPSPTDLKKQRLTDRLHCWFLRRIYPRPGMVIMLDAPVEVLYSRKQEVPVEYLESNRRALANKGCYADKFVTVDTDRPFDDVVKIVCDLIENHCARQAGQADRAFALRVAAGVNEQPDTSAETVYGHRASAPVAGQKRPSGI